MLYVFKSKKEKISLLFGFFCFVSTTTRLFTSARKSPILGVLISKIFESSIERHSRPNGILLLLLKFFFFAFLLSRRNAKKENASVYAHFKHFQKYSSNLKFSISYCFSL